MVEGTTCWEKIRRRSITMGVESLKGRKEAEYAAPVFGKSPCKRYSRFPPKREDFFGRTLPTCWRRVVEVICPPPADKRGQIQGCRPSSTLSALFFTMMTLMGLRIFKCAFRLSSVLARLNLAAVNSRRWIL